MSVSEQAQPGTGTVIEELRKRIGERVPAERVDAVSEFARLYTRRFHEEELLATPVEELFGEVMGVFGFTDGRGHEPLAVRTLNPSLETDGYATIGSILESNIDDMPFLVDSVTGELNARDLGIRRLLHPVIGTERGPDGRIERVLPARGATVRESVMHFEIDRRLEPAELAGIEKSVRRVLRDVRLAVRDFHAMESCVPRMIEIARSSTARYPSEEILETVSFLEWLLALNFVFLGYREYDILDTPEGPALQVVPNSGLGILSEVKRSQFGKPVLLSGLASGLRSRIEEGDLLIVSKTNAVSTVHRRARMDYVGVRKVSPEGKVTGEARLVGLFTSKAYMEPASRTPLLHRKLKQLLEAEDLMEGSHDHKQAITLFESFPKDELFTATVDQLRRSVMGLLGLQEEQQVRLFIRRDLYNRSVSLLVALPRDRFNAELRKRLQQLFLKRFNGTSIDYHLALGESDPAQIHFTVHVAEGQIPDVSFHELENEVVEMTRTWDDRLRERLTQRYGPARGRELANRWLPRLPDYYRSSSTDVELALGDIEGFEALASSDEGFVIRLQNEIHDPEQLTRVGFYRTGGKARLSDFMPILEALGLRVVEEVPTQLLGEGSWYVHDFGVLDEGGRQLDLEECGDRVAACIAAVWRGACESDSLNRLVVTAGLDWRQVQVMRAYRVYGQRVGAGFTEQYTNDAFAANPHIAAKLVRLFELRFDPRKRDDTRAEESLRGEILLDLDQVSSVDQDRVLRTGLGMVMATTRTNAYLARRTSLSFKLESAKVPEMPKPYPLYEIFVQAREVEAIHLRGGKVARGGIRWSDRLEDYRTEVLGLMKAQMTKNAVIVPTGSKGGFVLRKPPAVGKQLLEEVRTRYITFMHGLLDLTDNLVAGEAVHPDHVRCHDGDDPYLVVAADKGTAALSDTANAVAAEYGFWLGDAFASGGSTGYDHKALGITARGAWESVKRHFRELGTDVMTQPFTVVGIGDMSGDVFGNGMLLSDQICLVAAFDHRDIFIDPNPHPGAGFEERRRLFLTPGSTWQDYDRTRLSAGGGVYARASKSIEVSPEARAALGIDKTGPMPPVEVIRAILKSSVDLLWNGGIGTYVKASSESNADAGDRTNDGVRVNGRDLGCRVVGEGGNLGFTQRGRIEYAKRGGRLNTDFIDNSGGVDCSDHEVNLKILLGLPLERNELTMEERNTLVHSVADEVCVHVLYDNFLQAQILSQEVEGSRYRMEAYEELMRSLEAEGMLERDIEALPPSEEMADRMRAGEGMTRPELAVLLAYAKRGLTDALLHSDMPDSTYLEADLRRYFPGPVVERFGEYVPRHPLRRELVATMVANDVVNSMGVTFVSRTQIETGAEPADIARAFRIARDVTSAVGRWEAIEALVGTIEPDVQRELMEGVDRLVSTISRWYLARHPGAHLAATIDPSRVSFVELERVMTTVGSDTWRAAHDALVPDLVARGVPEAIARRHVYEPELVHGPDIIALTHDTGRPIEDVARVFFRIGEAVRIDWLENQVDALPADSHWHRWAIQALEDDLLVVRRHLAQQVLARQDGLPPAESVDAFLRDQGERYQRFDRFMRSLETEASLDLSALTVAVRQLRGLLG